MKSQVRRLSAALALGFAGGVTAPIITYLVLTHFGSAHASAKPPVRSSPPITSRQK